MDGGCALTPHKFPSGMVQPSENEYSLLTMRCSFICVLLTALSMSGCPGDGPPTNTAEFIDAGQAVGSVLDVSQVIPRKDIDDGADALVRADITLGRDAGVREDTRAGGTSDASERRNDASDGPECLMDSDCEGVFDSLEQCSTGICEDGECAVDGKPIGTPCDDGDICTSEDACSIDGCVGDVIECPGSGICDAAACNPVTGECETVDTSGTPCDDGDPCTSEDICSEGTCSGAPDSCPSCTGDADCLPYDDGDKCNGVPSCIGGSCIADLSTVPDCSLLSTTACTEAICIPASGACTLVNTKDGSSCDSDSFCFGAGVCAQGTCIANPLTCDDGDECTLDQCSDLVGCVYQAITGAACDDGDPCTSDDVCVEGACLGLLVLDCDDDNECTADLCDIDNGVCTYVPIEGPCDDGSLCTANDKCLLESCVGEPVVCGDITCASVACEPTLGCVSTPLVCDDGDECTVDECSTQTGTCEYTLAGVACDGDIECNTADPCTVGICGGCGVCEQIQVQCNDGNECTSDVCATGIGCLFEPLSGICDDGDPCTADDTCSEGQCIGNVNLCGPGTAQNPALSCTEVKDFDSAAPSGQYWLALGTGNALVYCDMSLAGGGWMKLGVVSAAQPLCNLASGIGDADSVAAGGPETAILPATAIAGATWPKRQVLLRLPQGDFVFFSTQPNWEWGAIADGTINASNIAEYQVFGGVLGQTLAPIASVPPSASFAGSPLLGGYAGTLLTPFLGIGATMTGAFTQDNACASFSTFGGFYGGTALPPALWNTEGSIWLR